MRRVPESGDPPPVAPPGEPEHWLVRPGTVRGLWIGFGVVLAGLVLGDLLIHGHPGFGFDGTFGFYAWYGLGHLRRHGPLRQGARGPPQAPRRLLRRCRGGRREP